MKPYIKCQYLLFQRVFEEIVKTPKGCKVYYKFKAWLHLPKQKWIWRNEGSLFERRKLIQKKTREEAGRD
jgi:hypothetical protein